MELVFTKAAHEELKEALELFKMASLAIRKKNKSQWSYWMDPPLERIDWIREGFNKGEFYFVSVDREPKVAMFRLMNIDTLYWDEKGLEPNKRYLHSFVVKESHKGKGIGASILKKIVKSLESSEVDALRLDCDSANHELCKYYESLGFQRVGEKMTPYSLNNLYEMNIGNLTADDG